MAAAGRSRTTMLAGWLFADLFLVLLVAGLAALPARSGQPPSPPPSPTATPKPTAPPRPSGLDPQRVDFTIALSPDAFRAGGDAALLEQVQAELFRGNHAQRTVGFVIVLASDDKDHIQRGVDTATRALDLLRAQSSAFNVAQGLGYWNGDHGNFEFKVFFLT